jgi:RHS repeat-associated protein
MNQREAIRPPAVYAISRVIAFFFLAFIFSVLTARAQTPYLLQPGAPTFTVAIPFELGYVNLANGVVHAEIPLASLPQRGGRGFTFKLIYDSNIWHIVNNGSSLVWQPDNVPTDDNFGWPAGGWRFVASSDLAPTYSTTATNCGGSNWYWVYSNFKWTGPNGTQHFFPGQTQQDGGCGRTNISGFDSYAQDSSGYHIFVTNYHSGKVYAKDGTIVADATQSTYLEKDVNGNFFTKTYGINSNPSWVDTLGRSVVTRSTDSGNNLKKYYDVVNSQGTLSRYTVTWTNIGASTSFGQAGVTEYGISSGAIYVIQTIALPDGTNYSFQYDQCSGNPCTNHYGLLTSVTLPAGGQINFTYMNFTDSYHNVYRWAKTRSSGGGTWTYTPTVISYCASGGTGCQQKVTFTTPAGDDAVHTFTHNNGAWNTQTAYYTGSASSGTLLDTAITDYDFSNACPTYGSCTFGAAYIRPIRVTTTLPVSGGSVSAKSEFDYDSIYYGNVSEVREFKYGSSSPDRIRDFTYLTDSSYVNKNILNLVTDAVTKDGSGNKVAETAITYDSTSLTSVTGITHHDDTNYGTSNTVRGYPTVISSWVTGTTYLAQTNLFDITGQLLQTTDPLGTNTTYSYTDMFYTENGNTPPQTYTPAASTNAYLTQVNLPLSGNKKFGYYFGSGKMALLTDQNNNTSYSHFNDSLDRLTSNIWPGGGSQTVTYTDPIHTDTAAGFAGQWRQNTLEADTLARPYKNTFSNDPDPSGPSKVSRTFDTSGRIGSVTNPYRSTSDPTYGVRSYSYDGLNRPTRVTNTDNTTANTYYGAAVTTGVGGITAQLCSDGTYGTGYPTLSVDEASKKRETWRDGFGRVIEVDEPDSSNNLTLSTCYKYDLNNNLIEIDQGSEVRTYTYDSLSRVTSETSPEEGPSGFPSGTTIYSYTDSGGGLCAGAASAVCSRTDSRGVTTTYTYDAENRLTGKNYNDLPQTPSVTYYYDQTSYNGLTITNGLGRRTGMLDGSGQTAWSYNAKGEVLTERRTISTVTKTISYTYNLDGSPGSITYPSGGNVGYGYNSAGQLKSASGQFGTSPFTWASVSAFAPNGAISTVNLVGDLYSYGEALNYTYDIRFHPSRVQATNLVGGGTQLDMSYFYYQNSNVHIVQNNLDNTRTATYTYDNLNRLSSAASQATSGSNCWGQSFTYDRYANLTGIASTKCSSSTMSVTMDLKNRVTSGGFTYDFGGNLTADGLYTYAWEGENRLASVNGVTYTYDGDGKRVKKSSGTIYWYDLGGHVLEETDTSGNRVSAYIYFNGKRVGRYDASGAHYAYLSDLIGSSVVVTDSLGHIQNSSDYYPFGGERVVTTSLTDHYKFTGMERDNESGLDHTLYRQLTSTYGRWYSPDRMTGNVLNPQSWNRYAYVLNNPVTLNDPLGATPYANDLALDKAIAGIGGDGGGGGGATCYLDGMVVPCSIFSSLLASGGASDTTGIDTGPKNNSATGQWSFYGAWADGSQGFMPSSYPGFSTGDVFNAATQVGIAKANKGTPISVDDLSQGDYYVWFILTQVFNVDPDAVTVYKADDNSISFNLTSTAFVALQQYITSNFGDAALHYPFTNGGRDSSPVDSIHLVWFDPNLTALAGGTGVYMQGHIDPDNPWTGSFSSHAKCVLGLTSCGGW